MIYQTSRRNYSALKTFLQWLIIFIAFAVIPAVGLDQWMTREAELIMPSQPELSNTTVLEGVTYNKHGRVQP